MLLSAGKNVSDILVDVLLLHRAFVGSFICGRVYLINAGLIVRARFEWAFF
jgi:hypothetical protein